VIDSLLFFALAMLIAVVIVFSVWKGFVPTYLTGGASRTSEPVTFWIGVSVLAIALVGCAVAGFAGL
jgi:hypothetical protein